MALDFQDLKKRISIEKLIADVYGVDLRPDGIEYRSLCPFHEENTPSFTVNPDKQLFFCFGCGATGDHLHFIQKWERCELKEAAEKLNKIVGGDTFIPSEKTIKTAKVISEKNKWKPVVPVPANVEPLFKNGYEQVTSKIFNPKRAGTKKEFTRFTCAAVYPYEMADGSLVGYVLRVILRGKKITPTITYCVNEETGEERWCIVPFPEPRILYRIRDLRFGGTVYLSCEGEKVADYLSDRMPDAPVLGWPGGSNGIHFVDWEPLRGRKVFIVKDNDEAANKAAEGYFDDNGKFVNGVAQYLLSIECEVKVVNAPSDKPIGWDCADEPDWDGTRIMQYIRGGLRDPANANNRQEKATEETEKPVDSYAAAVDWVITNKKPSISGLQRGLKIGYNKAARMIELMEKNGIISSMDKHGKRTLIVKEKPAGTENIEVMNLPEIAPPLQGDMPENIPPDDYDSSEPPQHQQHPPFRFLGFSKGPNGSNVHYFLANGSKQVLSMTAGSLSKNNLMELAPLSWWISRFENGKGKAPFNSDSAVNYIIQQSLSAGIYDPSKTRGRGAWWDNGKPAIHLGSEVVLGGERFAVENVPSRYIYELSADLPVSLDNPLPVSEAIKLLHICQHVSWEKPINANLLSGFIVCAIICGALRWRPHIWVTGPAGSGKSTVVDSIIKRSLGDMSLYVQGETSEAGIRQTLGSDALPVIFDEAESERKSSAHRMENVMALVTQASSDSSASILKGTSGGKALAYKIRSCFVFSSIAVTLKQHAARSRVTVLAVKKDNSKESMERFDNLSGVMIPEILTDEYISRLHARAIHMIPVIRKNAEIFSRAGVDELGSKRSGDQIGALLAGCYALHSNNEITEEHAKEFIKKQDWSEEKGTEEQSDEIGCLSYLMETINPASVGHSRVERTVGELIDIAFGTSADEAVKRDEADLALRRIGIKIDEKEKIVYISNTHHAIGKILRDKPWEYSWARTLSRVPGAMKTDKPIRFGSGVQSRAVSIPMNILFGYEMAKKEDTSDF